MAKTPYNLSQTTVAQPFDLIHIDIWGPSRVTYKGKYKYFVTIVDEYSRGTWVYLMIHKSESFENLRTFCEYARNQFGKHVKIVRSDNGLEFDDYNSKKYFIKRGIIHQISIVDRPQQNGVVERKHRHLVEISLALRLHSGLSLDYWGDCI